MSQIIPSGPQQDPEQKSPIQALVTWAKEHPKTAIGVIAGVGISAITNNFTIPAIAVAVGIGAVIGHKLDQKPKADQPPAQDQNLVTVDQQGNILSSGGVANDNREVPGPAEKLLNWVERHPRLAAAAAVTILMPIPIVGTAAGWLGADYAYKKVPALRDRNIEANAQLHENIALETHNPSKAEREIQTANQIRAQRKMTF